MSAPRVRVKWVRESGCLPAVWWCKADECWTSRAAEGEARTIAAASDAGRAHLAAHHTAQTPPATYCRTHGTRSDDCGCQVAPRDAEDTRGPQIGLERFATEVQPLINDAIDRMNAAMNGAIQIAQPFGDDFPCCNPIQRTYDESRADT